MPGRREERDPLLQCSSPGDTGINTLPEFNDILGDSGRRPGDDAPGDGDGGDDGDGNNPNNPPNNCEDDNKRARKRQA